MTTTHFPLTHQTASLSAGAQLFVFSIRQWTSAARSKHCIHTLLHPFYNRHGVAQALPVLDEMMWTMAANAIRPIEVSCPCNARVGADEMFVLQCLRALQRDDRSTAQTYLNELFPGPFARTFVRIAEDYVQRLLSARLPLTGARYLELVKDSKPES